MYYGTLEINNMVQNRAINLLFSTRIKTKPEEVDRVSAEWNHVEQRIMVICCNKGALVLGWPCVYCWHSSAACILMVLKITPCNLGREGAQGGAGNSGMNEMNQENWMLSLDCTGIWVHRQQLSALQPFIKTSHTCHRIVCILNTNTCTDTGYITTAKLDFLQDELVHSADQVIVVIILLGQ